MPARRLVALAAALEALAAIALIFAPATVAALLLGGDLPGAGIAVGRVAGFALLALALPCWPSRDQGAALRALLVYNLAAAIYFGYLALAGPGGGILLWPAFAAHALLAVLVARAAYVDQRRGGTSRVPGDR